MEQSDNIMDNVMEACSFVKRKAFEKEREWRLVSNDYKLFTSDAKGNIIDREIPDERTNFKMNSMGKILPYKNFNIKSTALKGIIINEDNPEEFCCIKKHIKLLLTKNRFLSNIDIRQANKYPL